MGAERDQWSSKKEYVLSIIGAVIGVGNIWRFPYLCFKHGGGAFLIPYFIFWFFVGIPTFLLESALGQLLGKGVLDTWEVLHPGFWGIGWGSIVVSFWLDIYYIIIIVWACKYFVVSFKPDVQKVKQI